MQSVAIGTRIKIKGGSPASQIIIGPGTPEL